jgi:DNA-binding NarL/FixJ family response regulator
MPEPIRVMLVDDHYLLRTGLATVIGLEPDMQVVAEADTAEEAVVLYRTKRPDVTLMDLRLSGMSGLDAIAAIRGHEDPGARIIVLSNYGGDEEIYDALQRGALSYLVKTVRREVLLEAIRAVAAGQSYITQEVGVRLAARLPRSHLSAREKEVLMLLAKGRRNQTIATELKITEGTVKHHVSSILDKLGVADRTEAVAVAINRGIIRIE